MKSFSSLAIPDECRQEEYRGLTGESTLKMQFVIYLYFTFYLHLLTDTLGNASSKMRPSVCQKHKNVYNEEDKSSEINMMEPDLTVFLSCEI